MLPPEQFALLSSIIVSSAGNQSLLTYLQTNTIAYHQNGVPLNIRAVKWLKGAGAGGKDRMVAYTNSKSSCVSQWFRCRTSRSSIADCTS